MRSIINVLNDILLFQDKVQQYKDQQYKEGEQQDKEEQQKIQPYVSNIFQQLALNLKHKQALLIYRANVTYDMVNAINENQKFLQEQEVTKVDDKGTVATDDDEYKLIKRDFIGNAGWYFRDQFAPNTTSQAGDLFKIILLPVIPFVQSGFKWLTTIYPGIYSGTYEVEQQIVGVKMLKRYQGREPSISVYVIKGYSNQDINTNQNENQTENQNQTENTNQNTYQDINTNQNENQTQYQTIFIIFQQFKPFSVSVGDKEYQSIKTVQTIYRLKIPRDFDLDGNIEAGYMRMSIREDDYEITKKENICPLYPCEFSSDNITDQPDYHNTLITHTPEGDSFAVKMSDWDNLQWQDLQTQNLKFVMSSYQLDEYDSIHNTVELYDHKGNKFYVLQPSDDYWSIGNTTVDELITKILESLKEQ